MSLRYFHVSILILLLTYRTLSVLFYNIDISWFKCSPLDSLPEKILYLARKNNFELRIVNISSDVYNMSCGRFGNIVLIIIEGNWSSKFSKETYLGVLLHEFGHAYYDLVKYKSYWSFLTLLSIDFGYIYIYLKLKNKKKVITVSDLIFIYIYGKIIFTYLQKVNINGYKQYHEYLADNFAVENGGKKGLTTFFNYSFEIDFYTHNPTFLFGLFNSAHPALLKRLNNL